MNDGTRDIGNTQGPVLLFRGLDPLSGPQAIAQAMKLSSGPGKEGAAGMRRIILIKDKVTMASWGFAFVEFVDVQVRPPALLASEAHSPLYSCSRLLRCWAPPCLRKSTRTASASRSALWPRRSPIRSRSSHSLSILFEMMRALRPHRVLVA